MLRACVAIEQLGVRTVAICTEDFGPMARAIAKGYGMESQHLAIYPNPGIIMTDSESDFRRKVTDNIIPVVVDMLAAEDVDDPHLAVTADASSQTVEALPGAVVFSGDLDEVQDHFIAQGWSDGLPIVPPTIERVERFLSKTDRDPQEILGVLTSDNREATVWNCAVNGVLAGCRPEYMPILVAIVEAIADPLFRIEDAGSTPGWEPLVCVSGPIVEELDFNYKQGAMRIGRQANSSIGRFVRLYMRNVGGLRIPPGATDAAGIGYTFNVAMAESDRAAALGGFPTTREELGFGRYENIVFVQSVRSMTPPIYSMGSTPVEHMRSISESLVKTLSISAHRLYDTGAQSPLLLMSPSVASVFSNAGAGRAFIREYLVENCLMSVTEMDMWAGNGGRTGFSALEFAERLGYPIEFRDGEAYVPLFVDGERIAIVIGGNPGRNQSRGYFENGTQGARVVRRIGSYEEVADHHDRPPVSREDRPDSPGGAGGELSAD